MLEEGMDPVDILIVGGGLTGLAAATAFTADRRAVPFRVTLIDAGDPSKQREAAFDGRASAITATSKRMFKALGVWPALAGDAQPMEKIVVTDSRLDAPVRPALLQFGETDFPGEPSAYMIENRHLYAALYDHVVAQGTVQLVTGMRAKEFVFDPAHAGVHLEDGAVHTAPLIAAADGRGSPIRAATGIETVNWTYPQSGIVTTVEHAKPHQGRAEENFLPAGPFAILPLKGNRSSLVWTEDSEIAENIMRLDDKGFRAELVRRFGAHLGEVTPVGPRFSYPLSMHVARSYVAPRVALLGDAAHGIHPIAGLGFNLALRDVAALADVLQSKARLGLDIGSEAVLQDYEEWRRFDNLKVALMSDGLNRLFSNDNQALRAARDLGITVVNQLAPVKRFFMREAAGLNERLPSLMR
ncbi:MAG: 2-octaprenyl-6-methoxyphenyl hydroxylase [Rhizobiales bacterium]|nr:2-octaprenyl-6-methoxyphenyl hydroxylase [Hyphomicrobiales bacterium]